VGYTPLEISSPHLKLQYANAEYTHRAVNAHDALLAVARMAMTPERDACDSYYDWHERLADAALTALAKVAPHGPSLAAPPPPAV
jgi:hypothetical protein